MRWALTMGRSKGPEWIHWLTWSQNWSIWLAWIQGEDFSHGLLMGEGEREGWVLDANISPGELDDGTPLPKRWLFHSGVGWRRWDPSQYSRYIIIDFPDIKYEDALEVIRDEKIVGMRYDWCGAAWLLVPKWLRPKRIRNRWKLMEAFCTELGAYIAWVLWKEGKAARPIIHPSVSVGVVMTDDYLKSLAGVWIEEDIVHVR